MHAPGSVTIMLAALPAITCVQRVGCKRRLPLMMEQVMPDPDSDPTPLPSAAGAPATGTRFVVLGVLCLLSGVLYLDRICISQALPSIKIDLNLSNTETSYVLMAFTLAYGLFEVPTGRWGDLIGARRVLTRISMWWSAFTALTGASTGLWSILTVRFLFGAGEAGAFPNVARVMSKWFPDAERGRAQGLLLAASQIGGALAPFLAALLIRNIGWRWTFAAFGGLGAVWAAGFWRWFRDDPATHPAVNAAEVAHIGRRATAGDVHTKIPWGAVVRNPSIWYLSAVMAFGSFNSYIYFSWFPTYLIKGRFVEQTEAGMMASMVLAFSALGTFFGGQILDLVVIGGGLMRRRLMGGVAFFAAAACLTCALLTHNPWLAALFTAFSCFMTQSTQPLWWSCAIGISGKHVGALFGLMNSVGVFGALSSQFLVGAIADWLGTHGHSGRTQWDPIFYINVGVLIAAGLTWSFFRFVPVEPLESSLDESDADR
jgi:ACS family glucarate transporter-like MFS transporter